MRSIPHRVVCLLGLDDGSFPRHIERDGDDLTARDQRVGDRDRAQRRPPTAARRAAGGPGPPGRDVLRPRRALQSAAAAGRAGRRAARRGRPHGASPDGPRPRHHRVRASAAALRRPQLRARRAGAGTGRGASTRCTSPAPAPPWPPATSAARSWSSRLAPAAAESHRARPARTLPAPPRAGLPARAARHLGCGDRTRDFEDAIPIELDPLEQWQIADRVLQARLGGADLGVVPGRPSGHVARCRRASWPTPCWTQIAAPSTISCAAGQHAVAPTSLDVHVDLSGGRSLVGHRGRRPRATWSTR